MFNDLVNESGWLTEKGKAHFDDNCLEFLMHLFKEAENENQVRVLGSVLSNYIGNAVSTKIQDIKSKEAIKRNIDNFYTKMSDEEFESYLDNKYGKDYNLFTTTLLQAEKERLQPIIGRRLQPIIERRLKEAFENNIMENATIDYITIAMDIPKDIK